MRLAHRVPSKQQPCHSAPSIGCPRGSAMFAVYSGSQAESTAFCLGLIAHSAHRRSMLATTVGTERRLLLLRGPKLLAASWAQCLLSMFCNLLMTALLPVLPRVAQGAAL